MIYRFCAAMALIACIFSGCGTRQQTHYTKDMSDRFERAGRLLEKGRTSEAKTQLDRVISGKPLDWRVRKAVMRLYLLHMSYRLAAETGKKIIEQRQALVEPRRMSLTEASEIAYTTSIAYHEIDDSLREMEMMEISLSLDSNNAEAANGLAYNLALADKELDRALMLANRAARKMPENPAVIDTQGWVHFKRGNLSFADNLVTKAVKLSPNYAELRAHLAEIKLARGNREAAYVEFRKAMILDPDYQDGKRLKKLISEKYRPPLTL